MSNYLFKEIPTYKIYLGFVSLLFFLLLVGFLLNPLSGNRIRTKAKIVATRSEISATTSMLKEYIKSNDRLPIGGNAAIFSALSATFTNEFFLSTAWTNSNAELVDYWQVPFQIEIMAQTNFVIRSAGPNKIFGDADDIIFNSASNGFVKP